MTSPDGRDKTPTHGRSGELEAGVDNQRRRIVQALGTATAAGTVGLNVLLPNAAAQSAAPGLVFPLTFGPWQNNGAVQWYVEMPLGTPANQVLKIAFDSGAHFNWVTSVLCNTSGNSCNHYGNSQFDFNRSSSFQWISQTDQKVDWGPWGVMTAETGRDVGNFFLPTGQPSSQSMTLMLAKNYTGPQFEQLDWDGGIAFPSGTDYMQAGQSFFFGDLMNAGKIDPQYPYVSFETDPIAKTGTVRVGGFDESRYDPYSGIRMPFQPYTVFPGVEYIWTTAMARYRVGNVVLHENGLFCVDSGSSRFKGDNAMMNGTLNIVRNSAVDVVVETGFRSDNNFPGRITVPPSIYNVTIEAGPDKGKTLPQFNPLGMTNLALVGSLLMDQFYTIYEYDVFSTPNGYRLTPTAIWFFTKKNGPQGLLGPRNRTPHVLKRKPIRRG